MVAFSKMFSSITVGIALTFEDSWFSLSFLERLSLFLRGTSVVEAEGESKGVCLLTMVRVRRVK